MPSSFLNFVSNVERLGGKKRGRKPIFNAHMFFPVQLENELIKITREEFKRAFEENVALALQGFYDDVDDLTNAAGDLDHEFIKKVNSLAEAVGVKAGQNFSKYSEMLVGQPYFPPAAKSDIFNAWKSNFQQLCKSAEEDTKTNISRIVTQAKMNGWNKNQLEKAIRAELPEKTKKRAELIARTEMGKLNSAANLATYKEVGIEYYVWMTTLDGRERESHKAMNGRICSVDDPTVYFEETEHGLEKHMRSEVGGYDEGHPGDDFQCRCSMVAWSQALDGKYEVKEEPAKEEPEQQKKPSTSEKLAEANKTIAQQNERLSALEIEKKNHKRIVRVSNKRHNSRKENYREELLEKRRKSNVKHELTRLGHDEKYIENIFKIEENIGVKYKKEMTHEQADTGHVNPLFGTDPNYKRNCQSCVIVYELRRRGFDIQALPKTSATQELLSRDPRAAWKDNNGNRLKFQRGEGNWCKNVSGIYKSSDKIFDIQNEMNQDGRYFVMMAWQKGGAHVIVAETKKGVIKLYDPQSNISYTMDEFGKSKIPNTMYGKTLGTLKIDDAFLDVNVLDFKEVLKQN